MNAANNKSSEQSKYAVDSFRSMYVGGKTIANNNDKRQQHAATKKEK